MIQQINKWMTKPPSLRIPNLEKKKKHKSFINSNGQFEFVQKTILRRAFQHATIEQDYQQRYPIQNIKSNIKLKDNYMFIIETTSTPKNYEEIIQYTRWQEAME